MKRIFFIVALALLALWYKNTHSLPGARQPLASAQEEDTGKPNSKDYCENRQLCGVIYVAPWCPTCKKLAPVIKNALDHSKGKKDLGLKVIVGQGKVSENFAEASYYGSGAFTDSDNIVHTALAVNAYPSFFVLDKDGAVVLRDQEAAQWMQEKGVLKF